MLSPRAREILNFIRSFTREKGYPPTIREIGEAFEIHSTNGVRYYLGILEKAGQLSRRSRISRGTITAAEGIPILGRVAAGEPIHAETSFEGSLETSNIWGDATDLFALKVRGDSMIGAGILADDYVIVRQQEQASAGEMIVALIGDEATVKYFHPKGDRVELVAANPAYDPIVVHGANDFRILGIVRGVLRTVSH